MLVVHVFIQVHPDRIEDFKAATLENARNSVQEPGIARFDVIQRLDDPSRFVLVEAYKTADAPAAHKETEHYKAWREAVTDMMAKPRSSIQYESVFPADARFGYPDAV